MGLFPFAFGRLDDKDKKIVFCIFLYVFFLPLAIYFLFFTDIGQIHLCSYGVILLSIAVGTYLLTTKFLEK